MAEIDSTARNRLRADRGTPIKCAISKLGAERGWFMPISVQPASNPVLPGLDDCIDDDARRTSYDQVFAALRARCPDHIEYDRWQQAIRDAATFLGTWGVQAHALGWTRADLFGLHPAPARLAAKFSRLSRRDALGLIWLLDGRPVIALTHQQAEIQGAGGVLVYRKLSQPAENSGVGPHSMRGDDDSARGDHHHRILPKSHQRGSQRDSRPSQGGMPDV
jgi:hypothetical protein